MGELADNMSPMKLIGAAQACITADAMGPNAIPENARILMRALCVSLAASIEDSVLAKEFATLSARNEDDELIVGQAKAEKPGKPTCIFIGEGQTKEDAALVARAVQFAAKVGSRDIVRSRQQ